MLTSSYHLDSVEKVFQSALELELSFNGNRDSFPTPGRNVPSVRDIDTMIFSAPSKNRHVNIVPDDLRVVEDV